MDVKELAKQLRKPEGEMGIQTGNTMNQGNAPLYALTFSQMKIKDNDKVMEVGFGNGKFIPEVVEKAKNVFYAGIDISQTMVQEAKIYNRHLIEQGVVEIKEANVSSIPYKDETFDVLFTLNTIYFWESPEKDILEIYRVLKKGGKLFIGIRPKAVMEKIPVVAFGFRTFELNEIEKLLGDAGFKNIGSTTKDEPIVTIMGSEVKMQGMCIFCEK